MMDYQIVPGSIRHVKPLSAHMRTASYIALQSFGVDPRRSLRRAFAKSFYCRTAIADGKPVAMWGIAGTLLGDSGEAWLCLSDQVMNMPKAIVREARQELAKMMKDRESIVVAMIPVDDAAIRFAVYLGFGDGSDRPRHEMERRIKTDPAARVSYGDSYVIPLTYAVRC